jgi:hypothetical protein
MRFRTTRPPLLAVIGLVAMVAALLVAPTAPASAAYTLGVSITTATPVVTYGSQVTLTVAVTNAGVPAPDTTVVLYRTGPDGVQQVASFAATDAAGIAVLTDGDLGGRTTYVAEARQGYDVGAGTSAPVVVDVAYAVKPPEQTSFFAPTMLTPVAVPPGGTVTLRGRIEPVGSTAPLTVEQRFGAGAWEPLGTVPVAADGTFALPLGKRSQVGTWTVRVTHPTEGALVAGAGEATATVTVTGVGQRTAWRPIAGSEKSPARWGTCRIGSRVNERRMPATGLADLREAMRRITQVAGIKFSYLGRTSVTPKRGYPGPGLNRMVVAWAPPEKSGGLLFPGIGGVGGTSRSGSRLVSGYLIINSEFTKDADPGFGAGSTQGLVLMHELGHVVGLAHSPDQRQVMHASPSLPAAVWGAADLRGLRKVGSRCR